MPGLNRPTGLKRRAPLTQMRLLVRNAYVRKADGGNEVTAFQAVLRVHDQQKGSCVGDALTGRIEPHIGYALSGVGLWTDARRIQGNLNDPDTGTDFLTALKSLQTRGVEQYVPGEETRSIEEDIRIAPLEEELQADDVRISVSAEHRVIPAGDGAFVSVCDAVQHNMAVCSGMGVRPKFDRVSWGQILDGSFVDDPFRNGHEMGIVATIAGDDSRFPVEHRACFLLQNSWGKGWGGYTLPCDVRSTRGELLPKGTRFPGAALVRKSALESVWDIDALQIATVTG